MSHSLSDLLLRYAQQFEDQHAPQNMTLALREAATELDRLYAGGCARDQGTTQYCAEAARLAAENERLRAALGQDKPRAAWADVCVKNQLLCEEIERLRTALEQIEYLDRPQSRGLPRRVSIQEIAAAALTQEPRT
jgi:hypothetical protein